MRAADKRLLCAKEVAIIAGIHVKTFYRLCREGVGPRSVVIGRARRYRAQDVLKWVDSQRVSVRPVASSSMAH